MNLRPYQLEAVDKTFDAWQSNQAVLGVAATGLGKTILFAAILAKHPGRTIVVAHREELIFQAADKIKAVTGQDSDIEMADFRAPDATLYKANTLISTIQTQRAGRNGGRMTRFNPDEFDLLIIDEAHHAVADSYRKVINHYRQNPALRVLGVTATPDRTDEKALGQIFDEVAFDYDIQFGIDDGWLVPIIQHAVHVEGLDFSACRTTAGDLNGKDLAAVMEAERCLHEIATPTFELAAGRKALVFAASLIHAELLCEIFNRHKPDSARWVHGKTPKLDRRQLFKDYAASRFQILVNVGVATEGFDEPGIELIVMARPTKSRSLYAQMVGRGTRTVPGIVDDLDMFGSASMRRAAIADSAKQHLEVVDFVGNCGKHRLITTADILGGNYSDDVVDRARKNIEGDGTRDVREALDEAEKEIIEEQKKVAAQRRAHVKARARYSKTTVNPFDTLGLTPWRERGWNTNKQPSEKMIALLEKQGINTTDITYTEARQLIKTITERWDKGLCSYKQAKILMARGLSSDVTFDEASRQITEIAEREGWNGQRKPVGVSRY